MRKEKLNFKGVRNVLKRSEMRKVMAGSGSAECCECSDGGNPTFLCNSNLQITCDSFCKLSGYGGGTGPHPGNNLCPPGCFP